MNQQIQQAINDLPREMSPAKDLWPGIEHGLENKTNGIHIPHWAMAAAVLAFSLTVIWGALRVPAESQQVDLSAVFSALHTENEHSKQLLLTGFQDRTPWYPQWQEELQQLEDTEQLILDALTDEPGNTRLISLLRRVQQKQLDLINAAYAPQMISI